MARLGKKTLYLDLDGLERLESLLNEFPGKPSLSSFLNDKLPGLASELEVVVARMKPAPLLVVEIPEGPVKPLPKLPEALKQTATRKPRKSVVKSS